MPRLTTRQRNKIIAEYVDGDGKVTQRKLAEKYKVSQVTISKILSNEEVKKRFSEAKKDSELSMIEFIKSRSERVQTLIDIAINSMDEQMESSCLRDKVGAIKVLMEQFGVKQEEEPKERESENLRTIKFVFEDTSIKKDDNGNQETT